MKRILSSLLSSFAVMGLSGCASMTSKENRVDSVVSSQMSVLKKIVQLRGRESLKIKLNSDPLLIEQETVLMSGLTSVIDSQEAFLRMRQRSLGKEGLYVH